MNYRELGRTGWKVSEISFGAWAIGGSWGTVDDTESLAALHVAVDCGVNFIDTADVYGMGRSERLIAQLKRERKSEIIVATKAGRRLSPHTADGYNDQNLTGFVEDSLRNLATDCLDLVQLHCPPADVYYRPEVFDALDRLAAAGKLRYYGVSVERVEEAVKAIEYPNVQTVQIIFNWDSGTSRAVVFRGGQEGRGRDSGTRSAGERDAYGHTHTRVGICRRRPPELQPPRREVRCGGDFLGRGLRRGAGCRG